MEGVTVINGSKVKTGTIESINGVSSINLNDGTFSFASGKLVYNGESIDVEGDTSGGLNVYNGSIKVFAESKAEVTSETVPVFSVDDEKGVNVVGNVSNKVGDTNIKFGVIENVHTPVPSPDFPEASEYHYKAGLELYTNETPFFFGYEYNEIDYGTYREGYGYNKIDVASTLNIFVEDLKIYTNGDAYLNNNKILTDSFPQSVYIEDGGGMDLNNSDILGANGIFFRDEANSAREGIFFPKQGVSGSTDYADYHRLYVYRGKLYLDGQEIAFVQ